MKKKFVLVLLFLTGIVFGQTPFELQKLQDFSKLYGAVRYFHPSDEASGIDWKTFNVYAISEIAKAKNQKEFKEKLKELFSPIAPSISFDGSYYKWDSIAPYPVYWIHNGLGLDAIGKTRYYSQRFNKSKTISGTKSFAVFYPLQIEGKKKLKLIFEVRTKSGNAWGYIKLFDSSKQSVSQDHSDNPVTTDQWQQKTILISGLKNIQSVLIGMFSQGGDSQFRNVQLFVENQNQTWSPIKIPALSDEDWFPEPKGDYIKKENGQITIQEIVQSQQLHVLQTDIPVPAYHSVRLSHNVNVIVPTIVYADENHTLPKASSQQLHQLINKLHQFKSNDFNQNVALANIIITWNVFRNFYPYQNEIEIDWLGILNEALREEFYNGDKHKHKLTLEHLTENFKDGHINIFNSENNLHEDRVFSTPVNFKIYNDKIVIKDIFQGYPTVLKRGDVITEIDNKPSKDYIDSIYQYISGSPQWKKVKAENRINNGAEGSELVIKTSAGKVKLTRNIPFEQNKDFYTLDCLDKFKKVTNDIYYVNLNKVSDNEIDSIISTISKYKGLILDLRGYPEDQRHRLFSYLPAKDTAQWLCHSRILKPNYMDTETTCYSYKLNTRKMAYTLPTKNVLLVDEKSISNAELFTQLLKHYKLATIVGRPTAGANGNVNTIALLGGFSFSFTGMQVRNPDGTPFHSIGVTPDYLVEESIEDIITGRDTEMEKAVEVLNKLINY